MTKTFLFKLLFKPIFIEIKNKNTISFKGTLIDKNLIFKHHGIKMATHKYNCFLLHRTIVHTFFSVFKQTINEITLGYKGILSLKGKGLRLQLKYVPRIRNYFIYLKLGYSHKIFFKLPLNMWAILMDRRRTLILYCFNYQLLQLILKKIRLYYPLNLYKLRGFSQSNEILIQKKGNLNLGQIINLIIYSNEKKKNKKNLYSYI